jgi:hypothetical protein
MSNLSQRREDEGAKMTKNFKLFLVLLPVLLIFAAGLFGQAQKGTLRIVVVDEEGTGLPGVTATLSSPVMMGTKTAVTDENGSALFINLTPGIYELKSAITGFQEKVSQKIEVSLDRQTLLTITLKPAAIEESVTVVAVSPTVDTTKSVIAEHVTHEMVESLPVARDFVGYLQLAAGINVIPNSQGRDTPEDPAGKGGLNYSDRSTQAIGGKRGSRDNLYFLDSMNITGTSGTSSQRAGMTFNNEVIQEQELMTSGVPAEYGGGKGVVGNIVTKAGGNRFSGSLNFYGQPKSFFLPYGGNLYNESRNPSKLEGYKDNKYDTAATLGGPILKDKLWFFGSGQYRHDASKFNLSTSASLTGEEVDYFMKRSGLFGKLSLKLTPKDSFTFSYFLDDYKVDGSRDKNLIKTQESSNKYNMGVYSGFYQRVFGENIIVDLRYGHFWWSNDLSPRYGEAGARDRLYFIRGTYPAIYDWTFGSAPSAGKSKASRDQFSGNLEWYLGDMRLKAGLMYANEYDSTNVFYPYGEDLRSLNPALSGMNLGTLVNNGIFTRSETLLVVGALNTNWDSTSAALDTNNNHSISEDEVNAARFTTTNQYGLNFWRIMDAKVGDNRVQAKRLTGYIMDDWKFSDYFTLNAGLRVEDHNYLNSEGGTILHMKPIFLPRLGLVWNIGGRGTHKLTAFYGHFSDPIPFDMIHFAGNISGRVRNEQVWLNNSWYTYRVRGSAEVRDCVWTPNTKDGMAREFSLTHEIDVGRSLVFSTQVYLRYDRNIIEDYDMNIYTNKSAYGDDEYGNLYRPYTLTYGDFGYPASGPPAGVNYFLSNLIGAKRDYFGVDFEVSKRFDNGSMVIGQYSFKDARGNSQSDGNADLQGDMIELDPRLPWMWGPTPGTINHKIKVFGTYRTPFGLDIGALFYWNSGMRFTESYIFLPGSYNIYLNWPKNPGWTDFVKTGQETTPSYYQLDLKFNYDVKVVKNAAFQLFLDIYNVTNNQKAIEIAYGRNDGTWNYKESTEILLPMRFYVGARIRF